MLSLQAYNDIMIILTGLSCSRYNDYHYRIGMLLCHGYHYHDNVTMLSQQAYYVIMITFPCYHENVFML
jgi:citrate lyase synthetase